MGTKVDQQSTMEPPGVQTTVTANASAAASSSSKISMFTAKSGFVIPKNKLSGSLVPIFRGSKKPGGSDAVNEESIKQVQRKTKWGPDLTQDAAVRKGRALAYQTRVDQITKQLSLGNLESENNQDLPLAAQEPDHQSSVHQNKSENSEFLELERQEAIGEILKLNPSFKAPPDYKPSLKEAKVPVPIKEYPGYNFIGIIFDPASDTQKRLEKETGAKIRVYGTKADKGEKVEITLSDGNEAHGAYEELYVQICADTYEKVDAAAALIEMVVTPVSVKPSAVSTTSTSVSTDNGNVVDHSQDTTDPPVGVNQEVANSILGSAQAPQGQFQPYPGQWFSLGPPQIPIRPPSGFIFSPNSSAPILSNPVQPSSSSPFTPLLFGPRPNLPQNPSLVLSRPQPPVLQHPFMVQPQPPFGHFGDPRNPQMPPSQPSPSQLGTSASLPFIGNQPSSTGHHPPNVRPLGPFLSQPVISQPNFANGAPLVNASMMNIAPMPSPRPMQSSSPIAPSQFVMARAATPNPTLNTFMGSDPLAPPPVASTPPPPSQGGIPIQPPSLAAPKPHPNSNDFTFQPHWPQNSASQGVPRPMIQNMRPPNQAAPPPQTPSFRPAIHTSSPLPVMHGVPRPQLGNHVNHPHSQLPPFGGNPTVTSASLRNPAFQNSPNSLVPQMGMRNLNPNPFPPRPGIPLQIPQNFTAAGRPQSLLAPNQHFSRPAFRPGAQQIYDPFSPTAPIQGGGDPAKMRKQESDPEYEDLMASVGLK